MPTLTNFDEAMQERIVVIPGGPTIPAELRDKRIAEKIMDTEAEGVLAMLVRACVEYHRTGLPMPHAVQMETERYRGRQDTVANFLRDCAEILPIGQGDSEWQASWNASASVPMTQAWDFYRRWAKGETHLTRTEFYEHMERQPGIRRNEASHARRVFEGLRWNEQTLRILDVGGN